MDPLLFDGLRAAVPGGAALLVLAAEHTRPAVRQPRPWLVNVGLWLSGVALMRVACGACGLLVALRVERHGFGLLQWLPLHGWLELAAGVVALDGVLYLWHRANHHYAWLWRWHLVHHAERAYQVTTALRFHPGELLLALPLRLAAIALLGVPVVTLLVFELLFSAMNLFVHGNVALPERAERLLRRVLVTPALHRRHHARESPQRSANFGTIFSFFDRAAATLRVPETGAPAETGIEGPRGDAAMSLVEAVTAPWTHRARG
jgi:sterol desaturase/sphingolipid hydroxylase (fatty acid hydroxylase superfamily)